MDQYKARLAARVLQESRPVCFNPISAILLLTSAADHLQAAEP